VIQTALAIARYALPLDPHELATDNCFEIRHQLRGLELDDEQIAAAEAAVELVRQGMYPRTAE
jgi:hypothetical protein